MHTTVTPVPISALARRLAAGHFVMTAEIVPPVSCEAKDLLARALPLKGVADAVNVTDGAGARAHMAATAAAAILLQAGIEPILQLTCRDRNRIALQSELMGAAAGFQYAIALASCTHRVVPNNTTPYDFFLKKRADGSCTGKVRRIRGLLSSLSMPGNILQLYLKRTDDANAYYIISGPRGLSS